MNHPLFAMDTCFHRATGADSPRERAGLLKDLGYAGSIATLWNDAAWENLPAWLDALESHGLQLLSIWVAADVACDTLDARLDGAIRRLAGRQTLVELALRSSSEHDKPSAPRGDARAAALIHRAADMAQAAGLRLALYPHVNWWMERVEDAVRLAMRVNRPHVGLTFNLFHWLSTDGCDLAARLQLALPRLWNVTINGGAVRGPRDCTIETLDRGTYDTGAFLIELTRLGYTGPVALQGYGVEGEARDNLMRSMAAYREMSRRAAGA